MQIQGLHTGGGHPAGIVELSVVVVVVTTVVSTMTVPAPAGMVMLESVFSDTI